MNANEQLAKALEFIESSMANGWLPYAISHGTSPAIEATAWAALALCLNDNKSSALEKTIDFLIANQNNDGGWSTQPGLEQSDWTSAIALLALRLIKHYQPQVLNDNSFNKVLKNASHYLIVCRADLKFPVLRLLLFMGAKSSKNEFAKGWPWVKNGATWVEPTSYSLMALKLPFLIDDHLTKVATQRANEYLLEHICEVGGWNCGNNYALGHYYPPYILTTSEALLGLIDIPDNAKVKAGLQYLLKADYSIPSAWSLAWSILALHAHNQDYRHNLNLLLHLQHKDGSFGDNFMATALSIIAINTVNGINPFKTIGTRL